MCVDTYSQLWPSRFSILVADDYPKRVAMIRHMLFPTGFTNSFEAFDLGAKMMRPAVMLQSAEHPDG